MQIFMLLQRLSKIVWRKIRETIFKYIQIFYDKNTFILVLQKGVYPYEYMDHWEKLNETSVHEKYIFPVT